MIMECFCLFCEKKRFNRRGCFYIIIINMESFCRLLWNRPFPANAFPPPVRPFLTHQNRALFRKKLPKKPAAPGANWQKGPRKAPFPALLCRRFCWQPAHCPKWKFFRANARSVLWKVLLLQSRTAGRKAEPGGSSLNRWRSAANIPKICFWEQSEEARNRQKKKRE